ncbi:hypothetical protein C5167_051109 [Papaver somniferum]|uniref:ABC transporter domain-containing protein n=1 Tax=Papaver somniferum TaxID=3469 RepID=A0A4Y7KS33_PAPSO|nr:hypothetical protein C5167_051109 [Papaver somniferum]
MHLVPSPCCIGFCAWRIHYDFQPWISWGHYVSPMMYAQKATAINEFLDERLDKSERPFSSQKLVSDKQLVLDFCCGTVCTLYCLQCSFHASPFGESKALIADQDEDEVDMPAVSHLSNEDLVCDQGVLIALVAVSGAGKTTLMDVLAGGEILVGLAKALFIDEISTTGLDSSTYLLDC